MTLSHKIISILGLICFASTIVIVSSIMVTVVPATLVEKPLLPFAMSFIVTIFVVPIFVGIGNILNARKRPEIL